MTSVYKYYTLVKSLYIQAVSEGMPGGVTKKATISPPGCRMRMGGSHKNIFQFYNKEFFNEAKNKR